MDAEEVGIAQFAEKLGLESEMLDDAVHDAASELGSVINNSGMKEQINFLVSRYGEEEVTEMLKKLLI